MDKQYLRLETQITSVNGIAIEPTPATVVTRFWPRQEFSIEVEAMPRELVMGNRSEIELDGSSVPLSVLHNGWPFVDIGRPGRLVPVRTPCQVVRDETCFCKVQFDIFNFFNLQRVFGPGSTWRNDVANNAGYLIGKARITADPWLIQIEEVDNVDDIIRQSGGVRVAHTGTVTRLDGQPFRSDVLLRLLKDLRQFLSFAGGSGIGFSQVIGIDEKGRTVDVRWGTEWLTEVTTRRFAWLPNNTGTDALSGGFAEYHRQTNSSAHVRFAIDYAISVYTECVDSTSLSVLPHIQIALETLCGLKGVPFPPMAGGLRKSLLMASIPPRVPQLVGKLDAFCKTERLADGPAVLVRLRNWMVHGKPRIASVADDVLWEATQLGLWYVELLLLHQLNYRGRYRIRGNGAVEPVPWVGSAQ